LEKALQTFNMLLKLI